MISTKVFGAAALAAVAWVLTRRAAPEDITGVVTLDPVEPVSGPGGDGTILPPSDTNTGGNSVAPSALDQQMANCAPLNSFGRLANGITWTAWIEPNEQLLLSLGVLTPQQVSKAVTLSPAKAAQAGLAAGSVWRALDFRSRIPVECG